MMVGSGGGRAGLKALGVCGYPQGMVPIFPLLLQMPPEAVTTVAWALSH